MESGFGFNFSNVRIHTDERARRLTKSFNAKALTVGTDIAFGSQYSAATSDGKRMMAHELVHVVQQSKSSVNLPTTSDYRQAEKEAESLSERILQRPQDSPSESFGIASAVSPMLYGFIQAQDAEESSWYEDLGGWLLGAIGGEFIDDPTYGQIAVDFVLSIIPYVDQVADARDLVAHIYRMGFLEQYNDWLRWLALVFTLVGLVPEVGSVIKSVSKLAVKGIGEIMSHLGEILSLARRVIPFDVADIGKLRRYILDNWSKFVDLGKGVWDTLLANGAQLVNKLPNIAGSIRDALIARLTNLRKISPDWLTRAFEHARKTIDDVLEQARQRLTKETGEEGREKGTKKAIESAAQRAKRAASNMNGKTFKSGEFEGVVEAVADGETVVVKAHVGPIFDPDTLPADKKLVLGRQLAGVFAKVFEDTAHNVIKEGLPLKIGDDLVRPVTRDSLGLLSRQLNKSGVPARLTEMTKGVTGSSVIDYTTKEVRFKTLEVYNNGFVEIPAGSNVEAALEVIKRWIR
jgi:hypothetical protein